MEERTTKEIEAAESKAAGDLERRGIAEVRQPFMGHDFLRRNLLVLLPPAIKPVTRPVN